MGLRLLTFIACGKARFKVRDGTPELACERFQDEWSHSLTRHAPAQPLVNGRRTVLLRSALLGPDAVDRLRALPQRPTLTVLDPDAGLLVTLAGWPVRSARAVGDQRPINARPLSQGSRVRRRSRSEVHSARHQLSIHRADVVEAYRAGASMQNICRTWEVDSRWLTAQFEAWGEPRRDLSEAALVRGSRISPFRL